MSIDEMESEDYEMQMAQEHFRQKEEHLDYINEKYVYTVLKVEEVDRFLKKFPHWKLEGGVASVVKNIVTSDPQIHSSGKIETNTIVEFYQALSNRY